MREIPLKFIRIKKKIEPESMPQTYPLGTINEKTVSSRVILKIVGETPQRVQSFKPT